MVVAVDNDDVKEEDELNGVNIKNEDLIYEILNDKSARIFAYYHYEPTISHHFIKGRPTNIIQAICLLMTT